MTITAIDLPIKEITEFCDRWQVVEFSLFGSVLRDDFRPDSFVGWALPTGSNRCTA